MSFNAFVLRPFLRFYFLYFFFEGQGAVKAVGAAGIRRRVGLRVGGGVERGRVGGAVVRGARGAEGGGVATLREKSKNSVIFCEIFCYFLFFFSWQGRFCGVASFFYFFFVCEMYIFKFFILNILDFYKVIWFCFIIFEVGFFIFN